MKVRLGVLATHPVQYNSPWFRRLAREIDLHVFYATIPSPEEQGVGFGQAFSWDVDLLSGYNYSVLANRAKRSRTDKWSGCDTPEISDVIREAQFDAFIVFGWALKCYWQAVRACRRCGVPVFVRTDSILRRVDAWASRIARQISHRIALRAFDGFLSAGLRNRQYLMHYGIAPQRIYDVPHFVDNGWFAERADAARVRRTEVRASWGADEQTLVILFVGKFISIKRPSDIVSAAAETKDRDVLLVFVGAGELESAVRQRADELGVRAHFAGFKNQTELPQYYANADVLVLSSESETWGLVVNESMACGTPVIVSDRVGCVPDLIIEGETGFTYRCGDIAQLHKHLTLMTSLELRSRMRDRARAHIAEFSVDRATAATIKAVKQYFR